MAFSEVVKLSVRRKSHFQCCLCKTLGVEIHHIIPQAEGGPDTEVNAAPLCPSCHETYGANPTKRKMISEARDVWYEICSTRYAPDADRVERLIGLLEGATSTFTGFQEYVNRIVNPEASPSPPQTHALSGTATGVGSASGTLTVIATAAAAATVLPGEARAEGSTIHATVTNPEDDVDDEWDEEDFQQDPRTEIEMLEALDRLFDQIWYNRHWNLRIDLEEGRATVKPEIWKGALAAAARVEAKYKDDPEALGPWSDFEWGMLNGKMSALRWVLGDEWEFLDT